MINLLFMKIREFGFIFFLIATLLACGPQEEKKAKKGKDSAPEVVSPLGYRYGEPQRPKEVQRKLEADYQDALIQWEEDPSEDNYIWLGRRLGYLLRLREAIEVYTEGLEKYPESYRLLRHRGHRYISTRSFQKAVEDFHKAAELIAGQEVEEEADGIPNAEATPLSNTQFNIYYHLGLAYYLKGEYQEALKAYRECMKYSINDDLLVATADWMYMTLMKLGQEKEGKQLLRKITPDMQVIENMVYHKRLLLYKGDFSPEELMSLAESDEYPDMAIPTTGYGLGNYFLGKGDTLRAQKHFEEVLETENWAAFGFIASESELVKLGKKD